MIERGEGWNVLQSESLRKLVCNRVFIIMNRKGTHCTSFSRRDFLLLTFPLITLRNVWETEHPLLYPPLRHWVIRLLPSLLTLPSAGGIHGFLGRKEIKVETKLTQEQRGGDSCHFTELVPSWRSRARQIWVVSLLILNPL